MDDLTTDTTTLVPLFRAAVAELRGEIRSAAATAVATFAARTGLTPSLITIEMLDLRPANREPRLRVVGDVRIDFQDC